MEINVLSLCSLPFSKIIKSAWLENIQRNSATSDSLESGTVKVSLVVDG